MACPRSFGAEVASFGLDSATVQEITKAEEKFRKSQAKLSASYEKQLRQLRATTLGKKSKKDGGGEHANATSFLPEMPFGGGGGGGKPPKQLAKLQDAMMANELAFLSSLGSLLTADQAAKLAAAIKPAGAISADDPGGAGLSTVSLLAESAAGARASAKHVYALKFFGDVTASQVATLRQEVTAVLRSAQPARGDEVVLVLNTGGGTVTGYGLAAAQLTRLKAAGVRLTICVEQVAASGGYMMACTADEILASPFAVLGSIGVITEQPNVYERLKKEGVVFSTITAGKFKRTLTPTKKIDPLDERKLKEDIEQVRVPPPPLQCSRAPPVPRRAARSVLRARRPRCPPCAPFRALAAARCSPRPAGPRPVQDLCRQEPPRR